MSKNDSPQTGYVKKETVLLVGTVALVIGFLLGVVLTAYKSTNGIPVQASAPAPKQAAQMPQPAAKGQQDRSVETAAMIFKLEKQAEQDPRNADLWAQLGHLYFDTENHQKSIEAYRKSLAIKPDNADVWTDMGIMYRRIGDPKQAITCFDKAVEVNPGHNNARFNKGIVLMHDLEDIPGAVKAWEELLAVNPAAQTPGGQPLATMIERFRGRQQP